MHVNHIHAIETGTKYNLCYILYLMVVKVLRAHNIIKSLSCNVTNVIILFFLCLEMWCNCILLVKCFKGFSYGYSKLLDFFSLFLKSLHETLKIPVFGPKVKFTQSLVACFSILRLYNLLCL